MLPLMLAAAVASATVLAPLSPKDLTRNGLSGASCDVTSNSKTILTTDLATAIVRIRVNGRDHIGKLVKFKSIDFTGKEILFEFDNATFFDDGDGNQIQVWQLTTPIKHKKTIGTRVNLRVGYLNGIYDIHGTMVCTD